MRNFDNLNKTNEKDILVVKGLHLLRLVLLTNRQLFVQFVKWDNLENNKDRKVWTIYVYVEL